MAIPRSALGAATSRHSPTMPWYKRLDSRGAWCCFQGKRGAKWLGFDEFIIKDVVKNKDLTIKDIGLNMMTNLKRMCREIGTSPRIAQFKGEIDDYPLHFGNPLQQKGIFRSPTSRSFSFGGPQLLKIIAPVVAATESSVNMARGRPHQSTSCTAATRYQHAGSHRHCFQLRLTSLTTVCLQGAFSTN